MSNKLVEHLERHLGEIQDGWGYSNLGDDVGFQIVRFSIPSLAGDCFSTLGLSNHKLRSRLSGKEITCELLMAAHDNIDRLPAILHQVGSEFVASGFAPLRGDVLGPRGPMFNGSQMSALYVTIPVYFPDDFASCAVDGGGSVVMIWLVPILMPEAEFVKTRGWQDFEEILERANPDLLDLHRPNLNVFES